MPHMEAGTEMAESYGGLEFQQLSGNITIDAGNADDTIEAFSNVEPVEPQGLDNDEIAELVDIEVLTLLNVRTDSTDDNQTELGSIQSEFSIEVNPGTRDGQLLNLTADGAPFQTIEGNEAALGGNQLFEDDEPGRLYFGYLAAPTGFSSGAEGRGGDGDRGEVERYQRNYRDSFGRGPAVDANDDLGVFIEVDNDNVTAEVNAQMTAQMAWDIHTVEGQRGQFHLP